MTPEQERIARRLRRLVKDAGRAGLLVAVDAERCSVRLIPRELTSDPDVDLREELGASVSVDTSCGLPASRCRNGIPRDVGKAWFAR